MDKLISAREATIYVDLVNLNRVNDSKLANVTARAYQDADKRFIYIDLKVSGPKVVDKDGLIAHTKVLLVNSDSQTYEMYLSDNIAWDHNNSIEVNHKIEVKANGITDFVNKDVVAVHILELSGIFN